MSGFQTSIASISDENSFHGTDRSPFTVVISPGGLSQPTKISFGDGYFGSKIGVPRFRQSRGLGPKASKCHGSPDFSQLNFGGRKFFLLGFNIEKYLHKGPEDSGRACKKIQMIQTNRVSEVRK